MLLASYFGQLKYLLSYAKDNFSWVLCKWSDEISHGYNTREKISKFYHDSRGITQVIREHYQQYQSLKEVLNLKDTVIKNCPEKK